MNQMLEELAYQIHRILTHSFVLILIRQIILDSDSIFLQGILSRVPQLLF